MQQLTMYDIVQSVIQKGACSTLFGKTPTARGPLRTADFIYECMIGVALELTNYLPQMFEMERQKHCKMQEFFRTEGNKGKYTDTYGWDKSRNNKMDWNFDPVFFNYFNRIIVPFLGGRKKSWHDENSKIWKYIKRLIVSGDKDKIRKLQTSIRNRILKESRKRVNVGPYTQEPKSSIITDTSGF